MSEDKKELSKEEKIEKAKDLMKEVKELKLSEEDLAHLSAGASNPCRYSQDIVSKPISRCFSKKEVL